MRTAGFHQANLISLNLDTVCAEVLAEVHNVQNNILEATTREQPPVTPSQTQTANIVIQDPHMASLLTLIINLTATVQTLQQDGNDGSQGGCGGHDGRSTNIFEPHQRRNRTNTSFYCWSHGACNHTGDLCTNRYPGHQTTATFDNRMNGCNFYCQPVNNNNTDATPYIDPTCSSMKNNTLTIIAKG